MRKQAVSLLVCMPEKDGMIRYGVLSGSFLFLSLWEPRDCEKLKKTLV